MKKIVVLYHGDCPDGFGGAWAAWKKFGNKADYIAIFHNSNLPKNLKNKDIYFVDFCPSANQIKKLSKENKSLTIIDHHISAKETVKTAPNNVFDNNHSGSVLAWQYLHKSKVPKMLEHIEDVDLWRFKLPHTSKISCALELLGFNFKLWDKFASDLEKSASRQRIIEKGKVVLEYEKNLIKRVIDFYAYPVKFEGRKIYAANSPLFDSQIANTLLKKHPPIAIVWRMKKDAKTFSLRSNGTVDVSKIAKKYGGGGHKASAGFSLPVDAPFPWKVLKQNS